MGDPQRVARTGFDRGRSHFIDIGESLKENPFTFHLKTSSAILFVISMRMRNKGKDVIVIKAAVHDVIFHSKHLTISQNMLKLNTDVILYQEEKRYENKRIQQKINTQERHHCSPGQ